jgi:rRNA-processing protein FCF1
LRIKAIHVFVSYTQQGFFVDRQILRKLKLDENDIIEMKLSFEDETTQEIYAVAKNKEKWNPDLEKTAYGKHWYSEEIISKILRDKSRVIVGYVDWNNLVHQWDSKNLLQTNPFIDIKKQGKLEPCRKLVLKVISAPTARITRSKMNYEIANVVKEKNETMLWYQTEETRKKPLNLRRTGLETLPLLGVERKNILRVNGINTILQLLSCPVDKLRAIRGISYDLLEKWIFDSSQVLLPSAFPVACQVFVTAPREQRLVVTEDTHIEILAPYYSQFFVRGHPKVESRILDELHGAFGAFYNISMVQENAVTLLSKDGSREINIFGPWIVEMFGFKRKDKAEEILEDLEDAIETSFEAWRKKDVILLISPQETYIEADQILDALVNKLSVQYSDPRQIFRRMELGAKFVIDTNVLIDGRLSSPIVLAIQGTLDYSLKSPEIIIPNIVTYEIKTMTDRSSEKNTQYRLADLELQRLRALNDAGYITVKYLGDIPQIPPITQHEKGTWKFFNSLRDEYILKVVEQVTDSTLLTQDGRLARSGYIKGFDVIHIKPLIKTIKEEYEQDMKSLHTKSEDERQRVVNEIANELMVSKKTLLEIIRLHSLAKLPNT